MAVNITAKIITLLKEAGIDYSKMAGKIDPSKIKPLFTKTQKTATKPKLINALNKDKATFGDALKIFENDAKYLSQMNEMEQVNFVNNLNDYFKVGGKKKNIASNVVSTEGTPVEGKKLETLAKRKGAKEKTEATSLKGAMEGLMTLVDEIKGISPKMRNQMDRDELVEFIRKMRGRDFTNQEIKWVREYMDEFDIGFAKEKASGMQFGKKLGAKDKDEFELIQEYVEDIQNYSPKDFRKFYGNVKSVNMKLSDIFDKKLEKHFKKKYKWDDTKKDGGLDDATFEKYEDELYEAQREFGDFHTVYDTFGKMDIWGRRKGTSWVNNPKNYLDEASEKLQSITGEGLNTNFWKNYTDEVLTKYPKPEKFQYGGIAGMLGERTGYDNGKLVEGAYMPPQNVYGIGFGPILSDVMRDTPKKGTWTEKDLKYLWDVLQGEHDVENIEDEIMLRFGRDNPEKKSRFFAEIGKDKAGIGWKKQFAGGGIAPLLGEPTYQDEDHRIPLAGGKGAGPAILDITPDDLDYLSPEEITHLIKLIRAGEIPQYAGGGRIGFSEGKGPKMSRRGFLKAAAGLASIPFFGKFFKWAKPLAKTSKAAEVVKSAGSGTTPPPYFFNLVNKIKNLGNDVTPKYATQERQKVTKYKDFELTENLTTGEKTIQKHVDSFVDDTTSHNLTEEVYMSYKPGEKIVGKNKKPIKTESEYIEDTTQMMNDGPNAGGVYNVEDGLSNDALKEISEELGKGVKVDLSKENFKKSMKKFKKIDETIEEGDGYTKIEKITDKIQNKAAGGRVPFVGGGWAFKLAKKYRQSKEYKKFIEELFLKTSTDIRRGEGIYKNLSTNEKIKLHDDLTKEATNYQKTGELPESVHQYFGINPEQQYADRLLQKQLKMTPEEELRQEFPGITDDLVNKILTDTNQQRIAEVKATMKEALKMQEKGMGTEEIINIFKKTPTKHASGGLAGMLGE